MDRIEQLKKNSWQNSNPLKAIKAFCSDCIDDIRTKTECTNSVCVLYDFREGTNPRRKKYTISEDHRRTLMAGKTALKSNTLLEREKPLESSHIHGT